MGMMERIGTHLSYLTEYSKAMFQDSEKLQKVRRDAQFHFISYLYIIY